MAAFMETPRFPEDISYGVSFGPEFVTEISGNGAGFESRNRVRSRALCRGEAAHGMRNPEQLVVLLNFFRSVGGRYAGFRFKDWSDFKLLEADSRFVRISGTSNTYKLTKIYQAYSGYSELRPIAKPVVGTVVLKDLGVTLTQGSGAGQYSVNNTTGVLTLVATQTRTVSTHTVGGSHRFTLATALSPQVVVGQVVSVSGVTGTAATLLNGLPLTVTVVSTTNVTVSVSTTALTAVGGVLAFDRQTVGLTASCEFDVPCRFDTDSMATKIDAFDTYNWGQIPVVELLNP